MDDTGKVLVDKLHVLVGDLVLRKYRKAWLVRYSMERDTVQLIHSDDDIVHLAALFFRHSTQSTVAAKIIQGFQNPLPCRIRQDVTGRKTTRRELFVLADISKSGENDRAVVAVPVIIEVWITRMACMSRKESDGRIYILLDGGGLVILSARSLSRAYTIWPTSSHTCWIVQVGNRQSVLGTPTLIDPYSYIATCCS